MVGKRKPTKPPVVEEVTVDNLAVGIEVTEEPMETPELKAKVAEGVEVSAIDPFTGEVVKGEAAVTALAKRAENALLFGEDVGAAGDVTIIGDQIIKFLTNGTVLCWRMPLEKYRFWSDSQKKAFLKEQNITLPSLKDGSPFQQDGDYIYVYENQEAKKSAVENG